MNKLLPFFCFVIGIGISILFYPVGAVATLICLIGASATIVVINYFTSDNVQTKMFLRRIFVWGLLFRIVIAAITYAYELQVFFCVDALTFDETGSYLVSKWVGYQFDSVYGVEYIAFFANKNWGISYLVAFFYLLFGHNPLAVQMFISILGAATAVLIYFCVKQIFNNERVSRFAAIFTIVFPSLALWSSQILKDGVIVFLIVATICIILKLQQRFSYLYLAILLVCLFGIYAFRAYVLFALVPAIIGSFVVDPQKSIHSLVFRSSVIFIIAISLAYFGFSGSLEDQLGDNYSLESLSINRKYLAEADSGFGRDLDVSTTGGALQALPIGFIYLMFAPFPWTVYNLRQLITLPEVLIWWTLTPFLISGLWYTFKNRLRHAISILLFLFILTVTYSISQGNVGTAYRQRAQIQVFYFIFISVGLVVMLEKRENLKLLKNKKRNFQLLKSNTM